LPNRKSTDSIRTDALVGSGRHSWYVVVVLTVISVFSYMDRQVLYLLVEPIKQDLGISDTRMGILMGLTFALFYSFFGIPLGRLADTRSRRTVIACGCAAWSFMTAGSSVAKTYWHLLLLRMGVGVGEATLAPSAYSMIADYFPKQRVATALSIFSMGIYIGSGLALILGGTALAFISSEGGMETLPLIGAMRPWRQVFVIVGLPGVALALLMLTVREPARRGAGAAAPGGDSGKTVRLRAGQVAAYILRNWQTFLCHNVGFGLIGLANHGAMAWIPSLLYRTHGLTVSEAGLGWGTVKAVAGTLGILSGGLLADWLARRGYADSKMRLGLMAALLANLGCLVFPLGPTGFWTVVLLFPLVFFSSMPWGAAAAAIQEMMPNPMRGQASAVYVFATGLIGQGLGPTAVALVTDHLFHDEGMIRYSLLLVCATSYLGAATLLWLGLRPFRRSLDRLQQWSASNV